MTDSILACQNLDMTFSKEGYLIKALKNVSFNLKYKEKQIGRASCRERV